MKIKDAVEQITEGLKLRHDAQDKVLVDIRSDQVAIHKRLSDAEKLAKDDGKATRTLLGAIAVELHEIRSALYQTKVITPEANQRCDEAWEGVEPSWPTTTELGTAPTEIPAQQRATVRERR